MINSTATLVVISFLLCLLWCALVDVFMDEPIHWGINIICSIISGLITFGLIKNRK